jgi:amino acid transporter
MNGKVTKDESGGAKNGAGAAKPKTGGVLQLAKAVAWSFLGIRKRADLEADAAQLNPLALILAGIIGAALFIGVLLLIVHVVVG